jgi:hypothetical protein
MPETWAPGGARVRAASRSPPFERGRGPPNTPPRTPGRVALLGEGRSIPPPRYWRGGGVAFGSAVPESAGGGGVVVSAGGVVDWSAGGGVAVVSLGGVVVESLGAGAVCSAGGSESSVGVLADCCFEQAATSRSAPTLRNKALRFIGSPHCLGCALPAHGRDQLGRNAHTTQAFRCRIRG